MTTNNTILRQSILNTISDNLGINDITPSSKIASLVDAFLNEINNIDSNTYSVLDNMYIESADDTYLDKLGAQEGLSKIVNNSFYLDKSTGTIQIYTIKDYSTIGVLRKGNRLNISDDMYLIFQEDVDLSLLTKNNPISITAELRIEAIGLYNVASGSSYPTDYDGIYISFNNEINVPLVSETSIDYRNRILFSRGCSKFGSEGALRLCVASTSYVNDYSVDYTTTPPTLYVFHTNLLVNEDYDEDLEVLGINTIKTELNRRKADTVNYNITIPVKSSFRIKIKPKIKNPSLIPSDVYNLTDFISSTYKVGIEYSINLDSIKTHLSIKGISTDFLDDYDVTFYKVFNNFEYSSDNNTIDISKYEYPFLEQIYLLS